MERARVRSFPQLTFKAPPKASNAAAYALQLCGQSLVVLSGALSSAGFGLKRLVPAMLKRFSSLVLALLLGGSALAGTGTRHGEDFCEIAGTAHSIETTACSKEHESLFILSQFRSSEQCCFTTPKDTGIRETAFNLSARFFSIVVTYPEVEHSSFTVLTPYRSFYSQVLPDLQHSYIRNLSLLI